MNTPDKLKQLRHRRDEAVLAVGAIDKEIKDELKNIPPLKVGDVYVTEPFQHWDDRWMICYYIIVEQDERQLEVRSNTNNGTHIHLKTLHFVVEQDHDHQEYQVGFNKSYPASHMSTWEYVYTSRRWTIDHDWNHDQPHFLCNLAEDKYTKEYWGDCADEDRPTIKVMLGEELMQGMNDLQMPNYFSSDEVKLEVTLRVRPEIYCLRMWAWHHICKDGMPEWLFVNGARVQPFRWYSSDKGMFILTEEGWLNSELETYCADEMTDEDMANWASHLELVEYTDTDE